LRSVLNDRNGPVVCQVGRGQVLQFIRFLNALQRAVPAGKGPHVILENYANHEDTKVLASSPAENIAVRDGDCSFISVHSVRYETRI
jgi:hypothetical protein